MNEEQFVNIVSQMLLDTGYPKTRDALLEEAKTHGFKITKKEIPLSKDLQIRDRVREPDEDEDRINTIELKLNALRARIDHLESIISLPNISI